jgi:iron complex outermembrane receptor protein
VRWKEWFADYKWQYYSDRQTSYSGTSFSGDIVEAYSLSDLSLGRSVVLKKKVSFKVIFDINNLLNREYQSVLSRPMPPRNYALRVEGRFGQK